jgi:uncharacterized repeat protein (TIGR03803 family)
MRKMLGENAGFHNAGLTNANAMRFEMTISHLAGKLARLLPQACAAGFLLAGVGAAEAQSFSVLYAFPQNGGLGNFPAQMTMIEGTDGDYYGTTFAGGNDQNYSGGAGTVFKVTPSGQLTQLWAFSCAQGGSCLNGRTPQGGVIEASDGNFYGMTTAGGTYNDGTIYRITSAGSLTTLYSFCWYPNTCSPYSGGNPVGPLMQASNGDLYGTTTSGTAFKISLKGKFKLLYTWPVSGSDGWLLQVGKVLYGTTTTGGANNLGSIFKMSLAGKVTTLYSFGSQPNCADGQYPEAGLVRAANGALYGTTEVGGTSGCGGYGTVFKITKKGQFTSIVSFQAGTTPANPLAPLVLAPDGSLYGTTLYGGNPSAGFVYQIANDTLANAWLFPGTNGCVGGTPYGGLMLASDGNLYGSDDDGDCVDSGTLFKFSIGNHAIESHRTQR